MLFFCCLLFAGYITNHIPSDLTHWILGVLFGIGGVFLYTLILICIGLFSFWFREIQPIVYLNLTATFCFGGLIVPLGFYSDALRKACFLTPYPWILWWPAETITGSPPSILLALPSYCFWLVMMTSLVLFLYRKCLNSFVAEGG